MIMHEQTRNVTPVLYLPISVSFHMLYLQLDRISNYNLM
jgi:hypothetical protein